MNIGAPKIQCRAPDALRASAGCCASHVTSGARNCKMVWRWPERSAVRLRLEHLCDIAPHPAAGGR
eukprot:4567412-Alexandrium_andersonii.AAC.1